VIGLVPGDQMTFENMLYAMLLPSANDVAQNVAANYPGGLSSFVSRMNGKALELRMLHSHFADPAGLLDDDNYTSLLDMELLTKRFLQNPLLKKIVSTKYYTVSSVLGNFYSLNSTNKLLGLYGVNGVKTGHTEGAKDVLISSVVHGGHTMLVVVMRSEDRFADTKVLLDSIVQQVHYQSIEAK
jgi:D-alanyl-D-alanine carboxypeptidase (penicillin-binding protein 5/6)